MTSQFSKPVENGADSALIERCLRGDQSAWADLVHKYQRLVYSVARTLASNSEDASDVFQQVWLELYQRLPALRNAGTLPAWLITVARRRSYALWTSQRPPFTARTEQIEITSRIEQIEREHALERALEQLPERCRSLIEFLYFNPDEPRYAEIAERMGMPVASIGPTRARCLDKLRKLMN